ncbi:thrombospondin type 3 repeat-containing protein, partial [Candidatus Woesearchaeota archaeon]|nr:thrombospondin type 3 repeat-containing protein [Candidatus Woesearchaeota archaeon]
VERRLNLDPNNPDVDNDGLTDSDELLVYGTNPLNANSGAMINGSVPLDSTYIALMKSLFEEYTKTLNPIVQNIDTRNIPLFEYMHFSDSDADGLSDFVEITNGLDPNDPDMDSDGYKDGYEIAISGTNPREADTDIDGLKDSLDLDPLINQEALLHMLPVIGDNYITIIADKDESFQLDVNPEDLYVNSNDSIQILMGNEQTKFQFNMSGKDSSLHMLRTPDGYSFEIRETTLRTSGLEFVEASNLTIVNVSMEYDVECLSLAPIGRYTWEGDFANEAFSVYVHNLTYSFCIQKSPDQFFNLQLTDCSQCGLYSFAFKQVFTRAMFEFEKKMEKFDYFSDAITSKGRYNTYNFSLDPKFNIVTEGNYDNFIRRDSIIHSSFFKIHNYDEMFFELLTAPIIGQFIQLLSIDGANITATHNVMTVTYNDERLIIVGEDTPEQDEVLARMRSFR